MGKDLITQVRIAGMRAIDSVELDLSGLTVLIGDNGSGKSTILEAFEILRMAAKPISFVPDVIDRAHGGLRSLLRHGSEELRLGVTIEGEGPALSYDFGIGRRGTAAVVVFEHFREAATDDPYIGDLPPVEVMRGRGSPQLSQGIRTRTRNGKWITKPVVSELEIADQALAVAWLGADAPAPIKRLTAALENVATHVAFETRPIWQQNELAITKGPRWPSFVEPLDRLPRHAEGLASAYLALNNSDRATRDRVLQSIQMGLGNDVVNFRVSASGRGNVELELVFSSAPDHPVSTEFLSEGQITFLAFVALTELHEKRSLLTFDEPELHLHPALLARVTFMLEDAARNGPILLATHSDRLLDALAHPANSVVLCDLDEKRATRLRRPNAARLEQWLEDYTGLGAIRAEGFQAHVFEHVEEIHS